MLRILLEAFETPNLDGMDIWLVQVLLVLGAAGGVGSSAVQIGKLLGAVVIGVAR